VRRSLISRFAISPEKVFVVPWGVDAEITAVQPDDAKRTIRDRFGVTEPYVLFCGCIEAKKNVQAAIRASGQAGLLLLIAGPWISRSSTILGGSPNMSGDGWLYLGYVSAADLSALYSAATALILPSHVEGFGLPAIEAMKCGCPVIASDVPALKEVCGGAALHVAPEDTAALTASLRLVASDSGLREDLSARGSANAERFSWAVAVDRFAEAVRFAAR
jgi:glycosyltransferase involved in cell wall biosynthesis